ncbi:hypothetical protein HPB47_004708 [Ixodes persulcatus]|uniref:Uncharacterized protein n=1 Tax=Ixodes persulcatus TaxID=34615 RepID=A0AC60PFX6_IXOPE|nr:hypothetical protein HPB47_004708 [Ixodes persulcatus]
MAFRVGTSTAAVKHWIEYSTQVPPLTDRAARVPIGRSRRAAISGSENIVADDAPLWLKAGFGALQAECRRRGKYRAQQSNYKGRDAELLRYSVYDSLWTWQDTVLDSHRD